MKSTKEVYGVERISHCSQTYLHQNTTMCKLQFLNDMDSMSLDIIYLRLSRLSFVYGLFLILDIITYWNPDQRNTGLLVALILNAYLFLDLRYLARKGPGSMSQTKEFAIWTGECVCICVYVFVYVHVCACLPHSNPRMSSPARCPPPRRAGSTRGALLVLVPPHPQCRHFQRESLGCSFLVACVYGHIAHFGCVCVSYVCATCMRWHVLSAVCCVMSAVCCVLCVVQE